MRSTSRYVIGIDLGTTNSAVAYIDTRESGHFDLPRMVNFDLLQLVAEGELQRRPTLPSFLYFTSETERDTGGLRLPWDEHPTAVAGVLAREQGALVPGRWVASAKSWLCHDAVDRTAKILPWGAEPTQQACSPVEAAARYLSHIREAWNHKFAPDAATYKAFRFEHQEIVLTVPASFDEEARELTVQAARDAGIEHLTLLEEPQAAFYAWSVAHHDTLRHDLTDGDLVLICDVGGGTTDLSLIRVRIIDDAIHFERTAIGEHVLLGGDNVDLALAHRIEAKLGHPQLTARQRQALRRQSCTAKEHLLSNPDTERLPISILGSGRAVVGEALNTELTRDEVIDTLLDGFLPCTERDEIPGRDRRVGLRELGLPYAHDPGITRHLARFLATSVDADHFQATTTLAAHGESQPELACPDAILFNGGFFAPPLTRERIVDVITTWFSEHGLQWRPKVLRNDTPDAAVAVGAAYYGHVRHTGGLRIHGGSARVYYVGVQSDSHPTDYQVQAVCVMPRGTEESTVLELSHHVFTVLTNQPVSFALYSSTTRHDAHGAVVTLDEDDVRRHAPLITVLRYGKRSRQVELAVQLTGHVTEVGTLELWCQSQKTEHRWRLQFQLRGTTPREETEAPPSDATQNLISDASLHAAERRIRAVFGGSKDRIEGEPVTPEELIGKLEATLGYGRDSWPLVTIRTLCDQLLDVAEGRKKNKQVEARWLNLFGFCLRPGFSAVLDEWRIEQARKIYLAGLTYPNHLDCQVQWLILWRRVAGGLNAGQQHELYQRHLALVGAGGKKRNKRHNRQVELEAWRLLASLERLPVPERVALGQELLGKLTQHPTNKSYVWSLGRLGARIPFAGPLNCVIPADTAAAWLQALLDLPNLTPDIASTIIQLGARTDDPVRDINDELRHVALTKLSAARCPETLRQSLYEYLPPARTDVARIFGESLPAGLRLVDSSDTPDASFKEGAENS